jgi:hypothetical protein
MRMSSGEPVAAATAAQYPREGAGVPSQPKL